MPAHKHPEIGGMYFIYTPQKWTDSNPAIFQTALACKLAKTVWPILSEGTQYDDRLFGPAPAAKTTTA